MSLMSLRTLFVMAALLLCGPIFAQTETTLSTGPASPAAGNVPRGSVNTPLVQFRLTRTVGTVGTQINFTALTLINAGTAVAADYSAFRLYRDNDSSGTVNAGDNLLATANSPALSFSGFSDGFFGAGAPGTYLVAVDINANATIGNTFVIQITTANITVSSTTKTGGPVNGNTRTINAPAGASAALYRGANFVPDNAGTNDNTGNHFVGVAYPVMYTIFNVGQATLNLTGTPLVVVGTLTNCTASVTTPPGASIAAGSSTTFMVTVTPSGAGGYSAVMSFASNDPGAGKNPYNWNITGTGINGADLNVSRGATPVPDVGTDNVSGAVASAATVLTYTLSNAGNQNLTITTPVPAPGTQTNCSASITLQPTSPVAPAGNTTFTVTVTPAAAGPFSCTIAIANNSPAPKNNYTWTISGTAAASAPTQLVITTQPGGANGGSAFATQPVIEARDAGNVLASGFTGNVTAAISTGPAGTLLGTATIACVGGVATFTTLAIDLAGSGYVLTFNSGALTPANSNPFNVSVGPAAQIAVTTDPAGALGGAAFATQPVVEIQDAGGNLVTGAGTSITASITTGTGSGGALLFGTLTVAASGGVATFTDLSIDLVGTGYTLDFDGGALATGTSGAFDVNLGSPVALQIVVAPGGATQATPFVTQPQVEIIDAGGNRITTDNTTQITAAIGTGTGTAGAVLSGTTIVTVTAGLATFTNLSINLTGTGYQLAFSDGVLPTLTSAAFNVTGAPTSLFVATHPGAASAGLAFLVQPVVEVRDLGGSVLATDNSTQITVAITAGSGTAGAVLSGTLTRTVVNGVANFSGLSINLVGIGYSLTFTSNPVLTPATSNAFGVSGAPAQLTVSTQPGAAQPGLPFGAQPVVAIRDSGGTIVASDNSTQVTATITTGTGATGAVLSGTTTVTAVNGVAVFSNLAIDLEGSGYTLTFTSTPVLTASTSSSFNVAVSSNGSNEDKNEDESCTTGEGASWLMFVALLALARVTSRRRTS
ncbi:hypothetical protein PLCT2_02068 [Planctomycetaceae bacterium]|nr:hypothetical protein PLCT2_02068 [Planctomycetaceae bacterium]